MTPSRRVRGDWPTPPALAQAVVRRLVAHGVRPASVLEPTCGAGAFLHAAHAGFPAAALHGYELDEGHLAVARGRLPGASLRAADAFAVPWADVVADLPPPVLILGNPPWVTAATLGALGAKAPAEPTRGPGLDALTGRANRDLAETLILRWLDALTGRAPPAALAMLCKTGTARRVLDAIHARAWPFAGFLVSIDARATFGVAASAALLVAQRDDGPPRPWPLYASLDASHPARHLARHRGRLTDALDAAQATRALERAPGDPPPPWRSGVKHDVAAVLELTRRDGAAWNGLGARVDVEPEVLFPLAKSGDLARGNAPGDRLLLLPQRDLREDPAATWPTRFPRAWAYLCAHRDRFDARRSAVYRGRPAFAIFGVGPYTLAPHKVAVSALGTGFRFRALAPHEGRPVLVDDASYLLACADGGDAERLAAFLNGDDAQAFLRARTFLDAKRPLVRDVLRALRLPEGTGRPGARAEAHGQI